MSNKWEHIEGETPLDKSHLRNRAISTREQLNRAEIKNVQKASVKYLRGVPSTRTAPFNCKWFLKLHEEMFGKVWVYAGKTRTSQVNIGIAWHDISIQLYDLELNIPEWEKHFDLLEQAVRIHHRAVHIHPFLGGNGRWSRLLANIWLKQHKSEYVEWPENAIGKPNSAIRDEYITAIKAADGGDIYPLIEIHKRYWSG